VLHVQAQPNALLVIMELTCLITNVPIVETIVCHVLIQAVVPLVTVALLTLLELMHAYNAKLDAIAHHVLL
jgi:hypothetical protein